MTYRTDSARIPLSWVDETSNSGRPGGLGRNLGTSLGKPGDNLGISTTICGQITWLLLLDMGHYRRCARYARTLALTVWRVGVTCRDTAAEDQCRYDCAGGSHNRAPARTDEELSALTDLISSINGLGSASGVAWRAICHRVSCGWMTTSCQPTGAGD